MTFVRAVAVLLGVLAGGAAWGGELRLGFGGWHYGMSGTTTDSAGAALDFEDDLALEGRGRRSAMLAYAVGRGLWPDLTLSYGQVGGVGRHVQDSSTQFGPITIPGGSTLATDGDFADTDLALGWTWDWRGLEASLGATAKWLKGRIVITNVDNGEQSRQPYDVVFPELHGRLRWPLGRIAALAVTGQGIEYSGDRAVEWRAAFELRVFRPLWAELAWQEKRYTIRAGDYALDADLDGLLVRIGVSVPNL